MFRRKPAGEVHRITGARAGLTEDVHGRERRYLISMLIRTACVVATALLWNVSLPLALVALLGGTVLPYVAVVIANGGRESAPGLPEAVVDASATHALEAADQPESEPEREAPAAGGETAPQGTWRDSEGHLVVPAEQWERITSERDR
ncbi:DUF3099 domain-containing protein [Allostreptomyces psammosilenae]|uniref:DUF3099 domain-containing protein n=1 Tax=Allostreptomyces psammosilenae TaxID=1892865 RepID=A0A852ZNR4_9ACTN|nr:DUF3099 domain-containing protein [Allostreptomyces psammosilenae]NYI03325.1 hypothetical protein [Allostreptomyces psammosilenae]